MTDHEKRRFHSQSSFEFLSAVPIKKRRFLIPHLPPRESPCQIPTGCITSDKKPESSELGLPQTGENTSEVSAGTGELPHECCVPRLQTASTTLPENKHEPSVACSPFPEIRGSLAQVNLTVGKHSSEPCAGTYQYIAEKNTISPASRDAANSDNLSREQRQLQEITVGSDILKAKLESFEQDHSVTVDEYFSADTSAVRGQDASSECCKRPSPAQTDDMSGNRVEASKPESGESYELQKTRDINICPKSEIVPTFYQVSGSNLATNSQGIPGSKVQEQLLNEKHAASLVSGSMMTPSASVAPGMWGNVVGNFIPSSGLSVKQEAPETKARDTISKQDAGHISLNRSNWDLNTTMDAWGGLSSGFSLNNEAVVSVGQDLEAVQAKRLEVDPRQIVLKNPGTDVTLKNNEPQNNKYQLYLPGTRSLVVDSNSEAFLDLQLKPSFLPKVCVTLGEHDAGRERPLLTASTKPALPTPNQSLTIGRTVKCEPVENCQRDPGSVHSSIPKHKGLQHVKLEPCEGPQGSKLTIPDNSKLACIRDIKPELLERQSLGCTSIPDSSSIHIEPKDQSLDPQQTPPHDDTCVNDSKSLDVAPKPPLSSDALHTCTESLDVAPKPPLSSDALHACTGRSSGNITDHTSDTVEKVSTIQSDVAATTEPSALGTVSHASDGNVMNSIPSVSNTSNLPTGSPAEPLTSNGEGISSEVAAQLVVKMDVSDPCSSLNIPQTDEGLRKPCSKIVRSDDAEDERGESSEAMNEHCDSICKSDTSHVAGGTINSVQKQFNKADDKFEDGEVAHPASSSTVQYSSVVTEEEGQKAAKSVIPLGVPTSTPLHEDDKENKVESQKEENVLSSKEGDSIPKDKVEPIPVVEPLTADSVNRDESETSSRPAKDPIKNDELDSNSTYLVPNAISSCTQSAGVGGELHNGEILKNDVPPKTESFAKVGKKEDVNDRGKRRIINLKTGSNCSSPAKRKYTLDRQSFPKEEGEKATIHRPLRREKSNSKGSRDDIGSERPQRAEIQRQYGHPNHHHISDFMQTQSRIDRLNAPHGESDFNSEHQFEQTNTSNNIRYSRRITAAEVATGTPPEGSLRLTKRFQNGEMHNTRRLSRERCSPVGRGQVQFGRQALRNSSPRLRIARHDPDFALLPHEDMAENPMLSHSRPQYEGPDGIVIHRERRSLSPPLRRGGPVHIPPNSEESPPRSQQRSTHQWSPLRRMSDGFNGQRDLRHGRSPPVMRTNRMHSPNERPCFPEQVIVRRRGSPHMLDMGPPDEHDFPRLVRQARMVRNMRRYNMIDSSEMMEDEYFDPHITRSQIQEFDADDQFVEARRFDERRGQVRRFRQRRAAVDEHGESFRFHDGDGSSRGVRLRPDEMEDFQEEVAPRDFNVRFRNRLGNSAGRLRDIAQEQEDNYRHHEEEEWRDTAFNDGRTKRRRF